LYPRLRRAQPAGANSAFGQPNQLAAAVVVARDQHQSPQWGADLAAPTLMGWESNSTAARLKV
jgi:hypothetical protein